MKAAYLLPCPCGKKIQIDAGQAGAKVSCECGKELTAPTFRALRDLEQVKPSAHSLPGAVDNEWNVGRGILFSTGLLTLVVISLMGAYHLYMYSQLWDGGEKFKQEHLKQMRDAVDYLPPADALADFQDMATKGLTVDGIPPWSQVMAVRDSTRQWLIFESIAFAFGLVAFVVSLTFHYIYRVK